MYSYRYKGSAWSTLIVFGWLQYPFKKFLRDSNNLIHLRIFEWLQYPFKNFYEILQYFHAYIYIVNEIHLLHHASHIKYNIYFLIGLFPHFYLQTYLLQLVIYCYWYEIWLLEFWSFQEGYLNMFQIQTYFYIRYRTT